MQTNKNKSWRKTFPEDEKVEEAKRVIKASMVDAGSTQTRETEKLGSLAIVPHDRNKEECLFIPSHYIWGDKNQAEPGGLVNSLSQGTGQRGCQVCSYSSRHDLTSRTSHQPWANGLKRQKTRSVKTLLGIWVIKRVTKFCKVYVGFQRLTFTF